VHIGTLMNLGVLYEDREEYDAAARCFRAVLKDDPTNSRARRYLADAEASRRQFYDESRERKADMQNAVLRIPVTDFELSVRARNCLQRMNIHTLGDLIGAPRASCSPSRTSARRACRRSRTSWP
jgi:DNA-directed RNA polymerase subunit alpha